MKPERTQERFTSWEAEYLGVLSDLVHGAPQKEARNGMTRHRWCRTIRHDMRAGFPLLTTKKVIPNNAFVELSWILLGRTDMKYLQQRGVNYWNLNYEQSGRTDGTLGPVYGAQMRGFNGKPYFVDGIETSTGEDQLVTLIQGIKNNPNGRRHLLSLWNPEQLEEMALPPCWYAVQFNIDGDYMDIMWNQRSADWFLGIPYDMAMMALFLELMAKETKYTPRYVVGNMADVHLYEAHLDAAKTQLDRCDKIKPCPSLSLEIGLLENNGNVFVPTPDGAVIENYVHEPFIKAPLL